jgi:hypothetical protein
MSVEIKPPSERFKKNLLQLFNIVGDMYEEAINNEVIDEGNTQILLSGIKLYISTKKADTMINRWIQKTHEHWSKIKEKDIAYFQDIGLKIFNIIQDKGLDKVKADTDGEDTDLVKNVDEKQVDGFKKLLQGEYEYEDETYKIFNNEREDTIWKIMESFVKMSICYIHETRRVIDGKATVDCFMDIELDDLCDQWGMKF